jgi:hypothetical protein
VLPEQLEVHDPELQTCVLPQAIVQLPQWSWSLARSTQLISQEVSPDAQAGMVAPGLAQPPVSNKASARDVPIAERKARVLSMIQVLG